MAEYTTPEQWSDHLEAYGGKRFGLEKTEQREVLSQWAADKRMLEDLNRRINWDTTCKGCADILDMAIKETERAERAESELATLKVRLAFAEGQVASQVNSRVIDKALTSDDPAVILAARGMAQRMSQTTTLHHKVAGWDRTVAFLRNYAAPRPLFVDRVLNMLEGRDDG